MSFSSDDNDAVSRNALTGGTGTQLYDANVVDPAKIEAVSSRWRLMVAGVHKALANEKGAPAANAAAAKAAFDTGMGQLKVDMRCGESWRHRTVALLEGCGASRHDHHHPPPSLPPSIPPVPDSGQGVGGRRRYATRDGDTWLRRHRRLRLQHGPV